MKRNVYGWILLGLGILCLVSCDEGRIYEAVPATAEGGRTVKFTGKVTGMDTWPSGYTVAVAGFDAKSEYALTSANVMPSQAGEDGTVQVVMSGVTDEVTQIELCVINRIRERVVTFARVDCSETAEDTIRMDVGEQQVGMFQAVQQQVFDSRCASCHGGSTSAAGHLFLTAGKSYEQLVNVPSVVNPDVMRVKPADAENSFLYQVLHENGHVHHDHQDILSAEPVLLNLIDDWINGGAKP